MSWSIGWDSSWHRDIGYGVPAFCDLPCCSREIDRGLAYVCGGEPYGGDKGCGLYFCEAHLAGPHSLCPRCRKYRLPYQAKPDHPTWIRWKLTDESWQQWRAENPDFVLAWWHSLIPVAASPPRTERPPQPDHETKKL